MFGNHVILLKPIRLESIPFQSLAMVNGEEEETGGTEEKAVDITSDRPLLPIGENTVIGTGKGPHREITTIVAIFPTIVRLRPRRRLRSSGRKSSSMSEQDSEDTERIGRPIGTFGTGGTTTGVRRL